jgi:hypothetical protein
VTFQCVGDVRKSERIEIEVGVKWGLG